MTARRDLAPLSSGRNSHRQRPDAVDEIGVDAGRRPDHLDDREARQQLLPQDAQLQLS
jgi:hypothetical protein